MVYVWTWISLLILQVIGIYCQVNFEYSDENLMDKTPRFLSYRKLKQPRNSKREDIKANLKDIQSQYDKKLDHSQQHHDGEKLISNRTDDNIIVLMGHINLLIQKVNQIQQELVKRKDIRNGTHINNETPKHDNQLSYFLCPGWLIDSYKRKEQDTKVPNGNSTKTKEKSVEVM